jgi:hypothetical protein
MKQRSRPKKQYSRESWRGYWRSYYKNHSKQLIKKVLDCRKREPEKTIARSKVYYAIKTGKLIKPTKCSDCNEEKFLQGHHEDYSKPLNLIWLCTTCHHKKHPFKVTRWQ